MVHYGKHIIDPQTGLCEICDRGAIHDLRRGKRTGKQYLYSNQDGKFTYRPMDDDDGQDYPYDTTPRNPRKPTYPVPTAAPSRTNRSYYDEPVPAPKRSTRRDYSPPPDDDSPRHQARSKVFYEVDDEGQMYPRSRGPPDEPRRRYLVQNQASPRRVQTPPPPPPPVDSRRSRPKRQANSDTEVIERRYRVQRYDDSLERARRAEFYHIESSPSRLQPITRSYDRSPPTTRVIYQTEEPKRRPQLEPIEKKYYKQPEPVVERKVYQKLPPPPSRATDPRSKEPVPTDIYAPDGKHLRLARKVETIYPAPNQYGSTPALNQTFDRTPRATNHPTLYHLRGVNAY